MEFETPGGSLSNQDFKKLMMTPRRPSEDTPIPDYLIRKKKKREGMRIDTDEVFAKPQKSMEETQPTYHKRSRESRYRDRALERRVGENPDYVDDNKMLREAGLPERKKEVPADTPMYQTPSKSSLAGGATPQYTPSYTPAQSVAFATPAPGHSTSVGGTTVTRLSSAASQQGMTPGPPVATVAPPTPGLLPDSVSEQRNREIREQIEKSKYLGGDVKHTHLVRGLDFALLQKVRQEISRTEKEKDEQDQKEKVKEEQGEKKKDGKAKQFATAIGERLYDALYGWQTRTVDTFLPGRTFYVVDFDENANDVPITQYRPKHELDLNADDQHNAGLSPAMLDQIAAICIDKRKGLYGNIKERKKREKEKERERQRNEEEKKKLQQALRRGEERPKQRETSISLPDEDIFPDAGEYNPDVERDTAGPTLAQKSIGPLFVDLRDVKNREEKEAEILQERLKAHAKAYAKIEGTASKPTVVDDDADPFSLNDIEMPTIKPVRQVQSVDISKQPLKGHLGQAPAGDYNECYPGTHNDDDDGVYDDMDADKLDGRRGHKRKRRSDFQSEEEWAQYKLSGEGFLKPGLQYPKKPDDGRLTHRNKRGGGEDSD